MIDLFENPDDYLGPEMFFRYGTDGKPEEFIQASADMRILRLVSGRVVKQGGRLPSGYGVAWPCWNRDAFYVAPIPFNLILGLGYRVYCWFRWKGGMNADDFNAGLKAGREAGARQIRTMRERHRLELQHAVLDAELRGERRQIKAFLDELRGGRIH